MPGRTRATPQPTGGSQRIHIRQVTFEHNGKPVMTGQWGGGVSTDPFFGFSFKGAKAGDSLKVSWVDNQGESAELETKIQ